MVLSRRWSAFLFAFGIWSWIIWPTFLRNIWKDDRSFDHGPTAFLLVHLALTVVSLIIGTVIGVLGWRGWRGASRRSEVAEAWTDTSVGEARLPVK